MSAPVLSVLEARVSFRAVRLRLPFRFGDTLVEAADEACLSLRIAGGVTGVSAQLLVPRRFDKRPDQTNADTVATLRRSIAAAIAEVEGARGTVAGIAVALRAAVADAVRDAPPLAAGFGPALVEMALVDAGAKAAARPNASGLSAHAPADLGAERLDTCLRDLSPVRRIRVRHTVDYDAPLEADPALEPDAPPTALADVVARQGIAAFKIKLKGDPAADVDRLRDVVRIIDAGAPYAATLDANEQYAEDAFAEFLARLAADRALARLRGSLRFIEKPLPREDALDRPAPPSSWPLLIDEADDSMDAFPRALSLGWAGTSVKSCKGVLRALVNDARAQAAGALLSGEDLTCQTGLCWQQDSVMAATLGLSDVERNGHHFAGEMQGASAAERDAYASAHPDVYDGTRLRVAGGAAEIGTLIDAPGLASTPRPLDMIDTEGRP